MVNIKFAHLSRKLTSEYIYAGVRLQKGTLIEYTGRVLLAINGELRNRQ